MNKISRELIVVLLAVMLFSTACGQGNVSSPAMESSPGEDSSGQEGNEAIAEDGSLDLSNTIDENIEQIEDVPVFTSIIFETSLEENATVTTIISPEGGSLTTTAADGTKYTLVVPEGALLYEEEISMTPIASAVGEVIGDSFLGGVKLEPEGLHFLELVSIEVVKPGIKEGAFGFTGQSEVQDFHMIPSTSGDGSVTITTTHFTEFVISQDVVDGIFEMGELASTAWLEHQLANGDESEKMAALETIVEQLINKGESGISLNNWESWTSETLAVIIRVREVTDKNKWNSNTPGFKDLMNEVQGLVDLWFQEMEEVIQEVIEKCIYGDIVYQFRGIQIHYIGKNLIEKLSLSERDDQVLNWHKKVYELCNHNVAAWQANVITTGDGLISDISLGAESEIIDPYYNLYEDDLTKLEVEYIDGFWEDICEPKEGEAKLYYTIEGDQELNLMTNSEIKIEEIHVFMKINEQVYIDCGLGYTQLYADAQAPFHGGALDRLNSGREDGGYWRYVVEYNPGGGVIGQFEEGPLSLNWSIEGSSGQYKLWQLVTIYNTASPACLYGNCLMYPGN